MQNQKLESTVVDAAVAPVPFQSESVKNNRSEAIFAEQTRHLFGNATLALAAHVVNGLLAVAVLWEVVSHVLLIAWYCSLLLVTAARFFLILSYRADPSAKSRPQRWTNLYIIGSLFTGIIWGGIGLMTVLFTDQVAYHAFAGFILAGMCAGAIATNAVVLSSYTVYLLTAMLPFIGTLLTFNDRLVQRCGRIFALGSAR